jgi:hypothetical protein
MRKGIVSGNRFLVLLIGLSLFVSDGFGFKYTRVIVYPSSVSSDANGPLDLRAELNYDTAHLNAPIAVVMHGYSPTTTFNDIRANAQSLRDAGFFAVSVAMRGRDTSDGIRDSGGVEIFDIYDAVEAVKVSTYKQYLNPDIVYITGYSGGGGNVMSALTKFPDYFRAGSSFFGMSDYGYNPQDGWYFDGAGSSHQVQMNTDIGNPTLGNPLVTDRYMARASNLASKNNPYSEIHLFVNYSEPTCPLINDTSYRDNAMSAETFAGEFSNITVHIGGYGEYEDFDGDSINDPEELQSWPHGFPTAAQQKAAESWFLGRLLNGQIPQPVLNNEDTLFVAGYVKTKPFFLWLGDGQNAAAELHYILSSSQKSFAMNILSSDTSVTGRLEIDVHDMAGQTVQVLLNGIMVDEFTAVDSYLYNTVNHGDVLVLRLPQVMEKTPDLNGDSEVDLLDFAAFAQEWQSNHEDHPSDLNSDGIVDEGDLLIFSENWYNGKPHRLYFTSMDSDPGWAREGQWQFGQPAGQGGVWHGNPDPSSGYSGPNVFGVNLEGDYALQVAGPYCLTLGPVDCRGYEKISLQFARWLNTDEPYYIDSRIEYSMNGIDWNVLWRHEGLMPVTDSMWTQVDYGLGSAADNQETVYIRWSYKILNNRVWPFSGWNIDDVELWGKSIDK